MTEKITMKITKESHNSLKIVQGLLGVRTLSDVILTLAQEHIETQIKKGK